MGHPLLHRPQAVPTGRDRGPGLAQKEGGVGGPGRGWGGHRSLYLSNKSQGAN